MITAENYRKSRAEVVRAMTCLRLEVDSTIADNLWLKINKALTAAYDYGFVEGIRLHPEFQKAVEADEQAHRHE